MYCWCQTYIKDAIHVLFECVIAQALWSELGLQNFLEARPDDDVFDVLKRVF